MYDDQQDSPHMQDMQQFPPLPPPPPPPAPPLQQQPFSLHPQQQNLPPLTIPAWNGGDQSPNAMSPTHDAPLTLEDEDFEGSDNDIMMGPDPGPLSVAPHSPV